MSTNHSIQPDWKQMTKLKSDFCDDFSHDLRIAYIRYEAELITEYDDWETEFYTQDDIITGYMMLTMGGEMA
jgi:hypothetical protein